IFSGAIDFGVVRYPHNVMIAHRLDGRVGAVFMDDKPPVGIRMFENCFTAVLSNHFQRENIVEHRNSLTKPAALIVTTNQTGRIQHGLPPSSVVESPVENEHGARNAKPSLRAHCRPRALSENRFCPDFPHTCRQSNQTPFSLPCSRFLARPPPTPPRRWRVRRAAD